MNKKPRFEVPYLPYFTELIQWHNWPPEFEPSEGFGRNEVRASELASVNRQAQLAQGRTGTIGGLSKKSDMRRLPAAALLRKSGE